LASSPSLTISSSLNPRHCCVVIFVSDAHRYRRRRRRPTSPLEGRGGEGMEELGGASGGTRWEWACARDGTGEEASMTRSGRRVAHDLAN